MRLRCVVIAQHTQDGIKERRLAICPAAPGKEQLLLGYVSRKRIADHTLDEVDQVIIAGHDAVEKGQPFRAFCIRVIIHRCAGREQVVSFVRAQTTGVQINRAVLLRSGATADCQIRHS